VLSGEDANANVIVFGLARQRIEPTIYHDYHIYSLVKRNLYFKTVLCLCLRNKYSL